MGGRIAVLFLVAVGLACGSTSEPDKLASRGRAIYLAPQPTGNTLSCGICHAREEPAADGYRRPGHPLLGAEGRPRFKVAQGSPVARLVDAINVCLNQWMVAQLWTEEDDQYLAVRAYLEVRAGVADAAMPVLDNKIAAPPSDVSGGDPSRGEALFDVSCAICHGQGAAGSVHAPALLGRHLTASYVADRVRTSGLSPSAAAPFAGGRMPFWSVDRLSDDELRDLAAFIAR